MLLTNLSLSRQDRPITVDFWVLERVGIEFGIESFSLFAVIFFGAFPYNFVLCNYSFLPNSSTHRNKIKWFSWPFWGTGSNEKRIVVYVWCRLDIFNYGYLNTVEIIIIFLVKE